MFRTCSETGTAAGLNGLSEIFHRRGRAEALPWGLTPGRPPLSAVLGSPPASSREVGPKASPPSPPRPPPMLVSPPASLLREIEAASAARGDTTPAATTAAAAREDGSDGDDATGGAEGGGAAATAGGVEEEVGRGVLPNPGVALWWSPAARRSSALSLASGLRSRSIRSSCACSKLRSSRRTAEDCSLPPSTGVDIGWGRSLPGWGSIARA